MSILYESYAPGNHELHELTVHRLSPDPAKIFVTKEWIEANVAPLYGLTKDDPGFDTRYDINGDGKIDIKDLAWFGKHAGTWIELPGGSHFFITKEWLEVNVGPRFGATRGDPNYHAGIDVNRDGKIDTLDLATWARRVGQTWYVPDIDGVVTVKLYKMPWVSWDTIITRMINECEARLPATQKGKVIVDYPVSKKGAAWGATELTLTVYASPIEPVTIVILLAILLGIALAGCVILGIGFYERGQRLEDISNILQTAQTQIDELETTVLELYEEDEITEKAKNEMLASLGELSKGIDKAYDKAVGAGDEGNWMRYFEEAAKWLPIAAAVGVTLVIAYGAIKLIQAARKKA